MSQNEAQIEDIKIIGGGDSGLFHALAFNQGLRDVDIVVIDNFEQPIPEVGKSTLTHILTFLHDRLGIDSKRLATEVKLAWKTTVFFEDWCGIDSFHSPLGQTIPIVAQPIQNDVRESKGPISKHLEADMEAEFHEFFYRYQARNFSDMYGAVAERPGTTPYVISDENVFSAVKGLPHAAYHFNSRSLNTFLRKVCRERGVHFIDDQVHKVETSNGEIQRAIGDDGSYEADLYVDASGFDRILMSQLDNPFMPFDLPLDSAVVTTVDISLSDIVSATVVTSGNAGWFWQIDTIDVRDLGYVYSSSHITEEEAKNELIESRDEPIEPDQIRTYSFNSGVLTYPWVNNCVAAGNALGFVEPLQSTALSTTAHLAERLTQLLGKHGRVNHQGVRDLFNESTLNTWEAIYNFISLYYKYSSGNTEFWRDVKSVNPGQTLHYRTYQASGFSAPWERYELTRNSVDINGYWLYYLILRNLGVESEFYENLDMPIDPEVAAEVDNYTKELPEKVEEYLTYTEFFDSFHPGHP